MTQMTQIKDALSRSPVALGLALAACLMVAPVWAAPAQQRPNIVFLLADDLGWTDVGCFGSSYYQTPNIDRLRGQGMKFTAAYTCGPNCAPTRACLMSGLYTPRHGIYTVDTGARGEEQFRKMIPVENKTALDPSFKTLAEALHDAGYATGHFGKWHLGDGPKTRPSARGFDVELQRSQAGSEDKYTGELVDNALQFIEQHRKGPFFVYLAFYAVHVPIMAPEQTIAKYRGRPPVGGHKNPAYAAMLENMDAGIGRVLERLDALKLSDHTLVIFVSDNGGVGGYRDAGVGGGSDTTSNAPLRGGKGMLYEGGVRVPMIVRWPGVVKPGSACETPVISVDFFPSIAGISGAKTPERHDGVSFAPLLRDPRAKLGRDTLYWHFPGYLEAGSASGKWRTTPAGAIRSGDWKLIEFFEDGRRELYNIKDDMSESRNLADANPAKRDELYGRLLAWRSAVNAPMPQRKPSGG
jgi:arylsulfatase A-like enzyme